MSKNAFYYPLAIIIVTARESKINVGLRCIDSGQSAMCKNGMGILPGTGLTKQWTQAHDPKPEY